MTNTHTGGRGRRRAEVVDSGLTGNSVVVGETGGVGVESGDGRGAGRVNGLNVNDDERRTTIEIKDHDVWLLRQAGAIPAHPSLHGGVTAGARAHGYDAALAEGGSEDNDKGLTHTSHMVMATVVWRRMPWGK